MSLFGNKYYFVHYRIQKETGAFLEGNLTVKAVPTSFWRRASFCPATVIEWLVNEHKGAPLITSVHRISLKASTAWKKLNAVRLVN